MSVTWADPGVTWADASVMWDGASTARWPVEVLVNGVPIDIGHIALPLEIAHGRSGVLAQPDAPEATFSWRGDVPLPADFMGARLDIADNHFSRFTGKIVGLTAVERLGELVEWQVRAVGLLVDFGRRRVQVSRPAEDDVARVNALLEAADTGGGFVFGNPGVTLAAADVDTDLLTALQDVCESTGGLVGQLRDGQVVYGTADHRAIMPIVGTLSAAKIVDGVDWAQAAESIVNHVTVSWGPEGAEEQNTHSDADSMLIYGQYHVDVRTQCAAEVDADQLALLILARRKDPYWIMPGALVHMDKLTAGEADLVRSLEMSYPVLAPITPTPNPTPGALSGWTVEGWVERWDESGHWLQLALSDRARWVLTTFRTWTEAATVTWADEAAGSWLDALIVEVAA